MSKATLVILNPKAGSGRAGRLWSKLEPLMYCEFGDLVVAITDTPQQVGEHLDKARDAGLTRLIAVGGDGTSHAIINAMLELQARQPDGEPMVFGQLPVGTGQDFARTLHIPAQPEEAIRWLAGAKAQPIDVGELEYNGTRRYFLNISSVGISGDVVRQVDGVYRYPWTYWLATVRSFLTYQAPSVRVRLDSELWYEGRAWLVAVANGAIFGRGMAIAPQARVDDGLFDVVLVQGSPRFVALKAFNTVYSGQHLRRDDVQLRRGREVEIESQSGRLLLDLDGEPGEGENLRYRIKPGAVQMLYHKG